MEDEALRARMGQESLEIIAEHDRTKILEQWETLYQRLASEYQVGKGKKQVS